MLPPTSLALACARKRGGKSQWHHSDRRGGGRREGKSDSRDASYSATVTDFLFLFFPFFFPPPEGFFWWQQSRICEQKHHAQRTPCWAHPVQNLGSWQAPTIQPRCKLTPKTPQTPGKIHSHVLLDTSWCATAHRRLQTLWDPCFELKAWFLRAPRCKHIPF